MQQRCESKHLVVAFHFLDFRGSILNLINCFPVFHLLFDLVFQDFSSLTLIPQFSCFSVFGDFVSIISSVTTSAALPPSFAVLEALQYSLLLCAKVLFRLFYLKGLKAICRGHALFLTILTARKTNLTQPKVR